MRLITANMNPEDYGHIHPENDAWIHDSIKFEECVLFSYHKWLKWMIKCHQISKGCKTKQHIYVHKQSREILLGDDLIRRVTRSKRDNKGRHQIHLTSSVSYP